MKKIIGYSFLFIIIASCKGYPDGPGLTFRTPLQRLLGSWKVNSYLIDGTESVADFSAYPDGFQLGFGTEETDQGTKGNFKCGTDTSNYFYVNYYWSLTNKNETINITQKNMTNDLNFTGVFTNDAPQDYTISRLTHNELWLKADFAGSTYEIHCDKI